MQNNETDKAYWQIYYLCALISLMTVKQKTSHLSTHRFFLAQPKTAKTLKTR